MKKTIIKTDMDPAKLIEDFWRGCSFWNPKDKSHGKDTELELLFNKYKMGPAEKEEWRAALEHLKGMANKGLSRPMSEKWI